MTMSITSTLLSFANLYGGYGETNIISDVSGSVVQGEVLGVFGRNGVGKTTLSKLLIGALPIGSGSILLKEKDISSTSNYIRRKLGMGYMPQTSMVFDNLTVRENLFLAKSTRGLESYYDLFP